MSPRTGGSSDPAGGWPEATSWSGPRKRMASCSEISPDPTLVLRRPVTCSGRSSSAARRDTPVSLVIHRLSSPGLTSSAPTIGGWPSGSSHGIASAARSVPLSRSVRALPNRRNATTPLTARIISAIAMVRIEAADADGAPRSAGPLCSPSGNSARRSLALPRAIVCRTRRSTCSAAGRRFLPDRLVAERVALVGVAFQEVDAVHLARERAAVAEHVQAVAQVDDVDQPVLDDRVAPHHDLLVAPGVRIG